MSQVALESGDSDDANQKMIREVTTLSRLSKSSSRIVRYYQAWTDWQQTETTKNESCSPQLHGDSLFAANTSTTTSTLTSKGLGSESESSEIYLPPRVACSLCSSKYEEWECVREDWLRINVQLHSSSLCENCFRRQLSDIGWNCEVICRITLILTLTLIP